MKKITFITTCKGRLHHVQQTLPTLAKIPQVDIVFVDYGCPQKSGEWVTRHFPEVQVVSVTDDAGFCLPRARNLGAEKAQTPWLFFIDADMGVKPELGAWLAQPLLDGTMYRSSLENGIRKADTWGSFICQQDLFKKAGGYDEAFRGWGGEDVDLYRRLIEMGVTAAEYPVGYLDAIPHDDVQRVAFQEVKDMVLNHVINETYMAAKTVFLSQMRGKTALPEGRNVELMEAIKKKVIEWDGKGRPEKYKISFQSITRQWLPKPFSLGIGIELTLTIQHHHPREQASMI
jgi:hypothetical protein